MSFKVAVIVAAAGASTRFGGKVKKPYARIDDRPVFIRTLELFINRDDVCQTILMAAEDDYDMVTTKFGPNLGFMGVELARGGKERWQTIKNAIEKLSTDADLVAVHDAVRPCLTAEKITEVFETADKTGAAMLATPVDATIKRVDKDGVIEETVDRTGLYLAQTPQVFKRESFIEAYDKVNGDDAKFTDDAQVLDTIGVKTTVVECGQTNIKITRKSDLKLAGAISKTLPKPKKKGGQVGPWEAENMW